MKRKQIISVLLVLCLFITPYTVQASSEDTVQQQFKEYLKSEWYSDWPDEYFWQVFSEELPMVKVCDYQNYAIYYVNAGTDGDGEYSQTIGIYDFRNGHIGVPYGLELYLIGKIQNVVYTLEEAHKKEIIDLNSAEEFIAAVEEKTRLRVEIYGDIDLDRTVTIKDVTCLQKYIATGVEITAEKAEYADFNKDGAINIKDATAIQKYLVGMPYA